MFRKYISLFKNNFLFLSFVALSLVFFVLTGGLLTGQFQGDEITYEYSISEAGSSVEVEGGLYNYDKLSSSQQKSLDYVLNGSEEMKVNDSNKLPSNDTYTVEKDGIMYIIDVDTYDDEEGLYAIIAIFLGVLLTLLIVIDDL